MNGDGSTSALADLLLPSLLVLGLVLVPVSGAVAWQAWRGRTPRLGKYAALAWHLAAWGATAWCAWRLGPVIVSFRRPWFLLLLVGVAVLVPLSLRSLAGLGAYRRHFALVLRMAVLALLVLAGAEAITARPSDRLTVIYLLDLSRSIPDDRRQAMIEYVNRSVREHRIRSNDRAGVIVFGREAQVEIPPFAETIQVPRVIESAVRPDFTNLEAAIKLALASFPEDAARRIVVVSDGNENLGRALEQARLAADAGVGIDVVPIAFEPRDDVLVEKVTLPGDVRRGEPFDLRIVVQHAARTAGPGGPPRPARGRLVVTRRVGPQSTVISDQEIELPPGKHVYTIRQEVDAPSFYTYEARFVPADAAADAVPQNNLASTFTHVAGAGRVLVIEDFERAGEHAELVGLLKRNNLEVDVLPSHQLFGSLAELQQYDTVVLANVPRENWSDAQIEMLVRNTHDLGGGLVVLGGENSFGAGGWNNTELEAALPVDFQIKNLKVMPSGALMLVMDCSGSMSGDKLQLSKAAAVAAVKVLGDQDQVGVVSFDSMARVVVPLQRASARSAIIGRIGRLAPGGGTNMQPGVEAGYSALLKSDASLKHLLVLTDGQTEGQGYEQLAADMRRRGITTSSVAIGSDAAQALLQAIATNGGGSYYQVQDPRAIPRIFMKEARRVARPVVFEDERGFRPTARGGHPVVAGLAGPLPPLTGYVLTTLKPNSLVELSITAPVPEMPAPNTILASWTYGLGRTAAFTTDLGQRWATSWRAWPERERFLTGLVRWSMRPTGDQGKFSVTLDAVDGQVRVNVAALDADDEFLNFLDFAAVVVDPEFQRHEFELRQRAPGRYIGSFPAEQGGNYFVLLDPGAGYLPLRAGVQVSYSAEFRDREADPALLAALARLEPRDGAAGRVIAAAAGEDELTGWLRVDPFRRDLRFATQAGRDLWPMLVWLAGLLFLLDVLVRRVAVSFLWIGPAAAWIVGRVARRGAAAPQAAYLDRLRSRKTAVAEELEQRRAAARFESSAPAADPGALVEQATAPSAAPPASRPAAAPLSPEAPPADDDYTARLLKAKRKVWQEREQKPPGG